MSAINPMAKPARLFAGNKKPGSAGTRTGQFFFTNGQIMTAIAIVGNRVTMTSREIAELTGSTHDNVLKTIRALMDRGVVSVNETPYTHQQNGQTYMEFRLTYREVLERDAYRCVYCGTHKDLSVDHIHPESKGGTLDLGNLQTLCRPCNSTKGNRA